MRLRILFPALLAFQDVAARVIVAPNHSNGTISDEKALAILLENQNLLPSNTRRLLAAQTAELFKRDLPVIDAGVLVTVASALLGFVSNFQSKVPESKAPDSQVLRSSWPNAKRKKVRYGPYRIPPMSEDNLEARILKQKGLANTLSLGARKPYEDDMVILDLEANIENADGSPADPAGAWLHHAVLMAVGTKVRGADCDNSLIDYFFESGNEKTHIGYANPNATFKSGYHLRSGDLLMLNTELMNMDEQEKWVWLTLTFDYLEGTHHEYKESKIMWMSIGPPRCGGTNQVNPFGASNLTENLQPLKAVVEENSFPWVSPEDGYLLGLNGHMHDGGVGIDVFKAGEVVCNSVPQYAMGGTGHMKRQIMGGNYTNNNIEHIAKQDGCWFDPPLKLVKGDKLYLKSSFDFDKHPGMKNIKGELDAVMGMMGGLVAFESKRR